MVIKETNQMSHFVLSNHQPYGYQGNYEYSTRIPILDNKET